MGRLETRRESRYVWTVKEMWQWDVSGVEVEAQVVVVASGRWKVEGGNARRCHGGR